MINLKQSEKPISQTGYQQSLNPNIMYSQPPPDARADANADITNTYLFRILKQLEAIATYLDEKNSDE